MGKEMDELPRWTLLHAVRAVADSWNEVKPDTIQNCWNAAGFYYGATDPVDATNTEKGDYLGLSADFSEYIKRVPNVNVNVEEFITVDEDIAVCDACCEPESQEREDDHVTSDESEEENCLASKPSREEIDRALQTLHETGVHYSVDERYGSLLKEMENIVENAICKAKRQSAITDFFTSK